MVLSLASSATLSLVLPESEGMTTMERAVRLALPVMTSSAGKSMKVGKVLLRCRYCTAGSMR